MKSESGRRKSDCGSRKKATQLSPVASLLKEQSFRRYALYPTPSARFFIIPNSAFPLPHSHNRYHPSQRVFGLAVLNILNGVEKALRHRSDTAVAEVMSSPLITVAPDESTRDAMETMTECRCRHLVVMEGEEMVGIVSLGDLVKHMLVQAEAEVEQLSSYIAGSY